MHRPSDFNQLDLSVLVDQVRHPSCPTINLTQHGSLTLPLLVARICTYDVHLAPSFYDFAVFTDSFDAGADLHRGFALKILSFLEAQQYMDYWAMFTRPNFVRFRSNYEAHPVLFPVRTK